MKLADISVDERGDKLVPIYSTGLDYPNLMYPSLTNLPTQGIINLMECH